MNMRMYFLVLSMKAFNMLSFFVQIHYFSRLYVRVTKKKKRKDNE